MRIVGASSEGFQPRAAVAAQHLRRAASEAPGSALIAVEAPRRANPLCSQCSILLRLSSRTARDADACPQTRARRRAEPEEAIAVYRSMTKPVPCKRAYRYARLIVRPLDP